MELVRMAPPQRELEARHILDTGFRDGEEPSWRRRSLDLNLPSAAVAAARRLVRDVTPKGTPRSGNDSGRGSRSGSASDSGSGSEARRSDSSDNDGASLASRDGSGDSGGGGNGGSSDSPRTAGSVAGREVRGSTDAPVNHAMISRHQRVQEAQEKPPRGDFPAPLLLLVPRLRRRASPAEKLFWFGSHHLYLWLVEFNLFSATLLASIAVAAYSTAATKGKAKIDSLDVAVLCLSIGGLAYVLLRTAQSLKLYTFVLNCSGLVPEELALDAIGEIKASGRGRFSYCSDDETDGDFRRHGGRGGSRPSRRSGGSADSGSDSGGGVGGGEDSDSGEGRLGREEAREAVKERRRKFWRFMTTSSAGVLEDQSDVGGGGGAGAADGSASAAPSEAALSRRQRLRDGLSRRRRREQRSAAERRLAAATAAAAATGGVRRRLSR